MNPRHDTLDIAVDHHSALIKSNRSDGGRRVWPNAWQCEQLSLGLGKAPVVDGGHNLSTPMQVAGPRVVAKPCPGGHHIIGRSSGQLLNRGPAGKELFKVRLYGGDCCLLQHNFAQPYRIGINIGTRQCAPWHHAAAPVIPA